MRLAALWRGEHRRLLLFGCVVAVAFVSAAAVGRAVGPIERGGESESGAAEHSEPSADAAHDAVDGSAADADGLSVASGELRLALVRTTLEAAQPQVVAFEILDRSGRPVRSFDLTHERRMHLIVARRDLSGFQHLHPELGADGTWVTTASPLEPGSYRAFADFSEGGNRTALGVDLVVPGASTVEALPPSEEAARVGEYRVELESDELVAGVPSLLRFRISSAGRPVEPEPNLGARGHLVILREGDLAYLHTHPEKEDTTEIRMQTTFPSAGRYRAFLQFVVDGAVQTAAFTIEVDR